MINSQLSNEPSANESAYDEGPIKSILEVTQEEIQAGRVPKNSIYYSILGQVIEERKFSQGKTFTQTHLHQIDN